jgi:hypothetical protein
MRNLASVLLILLWYSIPAVAGDPPVFKLIKEYSNDPELSLLSHEDILSLLKTARFLGRTRNPLIERREDGYYLLANVAQDTSAYNDIRLNKMQMLASSVESRAHALKQIEAKIPNLSILKGVGFFWDIDHCNFLHEVNPRSERVKLYVPLNALRDFADGSLSVYELVGRSLTLVEDTQVTFTSWDPIGAY